MLTDENIAKMSILPKANYRFNEIPIKVPKALSQKQNNHKICMEPQKTSDSQSNLEKEQQYDAGNIMSPYFKLRYKIIVIKTLGY